MKQNKQARSYIRFHREAILSFIKMTGTDFMCSFSAPTEQRKWTRIFKSDRGNATQILTQFLEVVKILKKTHMQRHTGCNLDNCGLLLSMESWLNSISELLSPKKRNKKEEYQPGDYVLSTFSPCKDPVPIKLQYRLTHDIWVANAVGSRRRIYTLAKQIKGRYNHP